MNVYDSDRMYDLLRPLGYVRKDTPEGSSVIILNTCYIREKAAEKVYSDLGRMKSFKKKYGSVFIVAGCLAQAEGVLSQKRADVVDFVVGPQSYHKIAAIVSRLDKTRNIFTDFDTNEKFDTLNEIKNKSTKYSFFVTVQEGCDKFCTFCVVPYVRGPQVCRSVSGVIDEINSVLDGGSAKEVILLGQNVNSYFCVEKAKTYHFHDLIEAISSKTAVSRIRYTTSHPCDFHTSLAQLHGSLPKLMPHIHLPVQSGSDKILKSMNRQHTIDKYKSIIDEIRCLCSDIALSSDFIVGFPGEEDKDFQDTIDLIQNVNFAHSYSFKYSRRYGTSAAIARYQIGESVKKERLKLLQSILNDQKRAFNLNFVSKIVTVLVEERVDDDMYVGRSPHWQKVQIQSSSDIIGRIVPVYIHSASIYCLSGFFEKEVKIEK